MQVVFRTDASGAIGSGHVMRCLTLAESLRDGGAQVAFVARLHEGNLNGLLRSRGFEVADLSELPSPPAQEQRTPPTQVAADTHRDAHETRAAIRALGAQPTWLVVDHYGLDHRWETELRDTAAQILVIDDLADRHHDCNLLLDQNLVTGMATRYAGKVPERCTSLLGPRYALLQPVYADLHHQVAPRTGPVRRICIYFGAADRYGLTQLALRAFLGLGKRDIEVDVVVDGAAADAAGLLAFAAGHVNVRVHGRQPTLAHLLAGADLAVGAAGTTSWERLCLGVPSVVVTLADNQRPLAAALGERRLIDWLGHYDEVELADLQNALARHIAAGADRASSSAGQALIDGEGARRVRAALMVNANSPVRVRPAVAADEHLLLQWANDPTTRRNSFDPRVIAAELHHRWLQDKLSAGRNCLLLVVETADAVPLATVRFDRTEAGWKISYSLAAEYRGRGLGLRIVELALATLARQYPESSCVVARVMAANEPSQRLFRRLGFEVVSNTAGAVEYRRSL